MFLVLSFVSACNDSMQKTAVAFFCRRSIAQRYHLHPKQRLRKGKTMKLSKLKLTLLAATLNFGTMFAQQQTAPSQQPVTVPAQNTTAPTAAPMTKDEMKAEKMQQKSQEKAAKEQAKADKAKSKALKHQDKATNAAQAAQPPAK